MFYHLYSNLCEKKRVSMSRAAEQIGLSRTSVVKWKNGAVPSGATLQKIADYFQVSVDSLLSEQSKSHTPENSEKLTSVYFNFAKTAQENQIDPEDINAAIEIIQKLRNKNNDIP